MTTLTREQIYNAIGKEEKVLSAFKKRLAIYVQDLSQIYGHKEVRKLLDECEEKVKIILKP
ncbi:hypothetical protein ABE151_17330 [Bacillus paralicheniformis]|uniref:hypothetical protein n=1 Tax=Bacillus paralicheniformis TaxID=1648923 RepID=UPI003D23D605